MELHVPPELEAKLNRLAADTGRDAEQIALDLLAGFVEHEGWFRRGSRKAVSQRERAGCLTTTRSGHASTGSYWG